jgi:glycosyltransferase involved in cell wall biosynthesis
MRILLATLCLNEIEWLPRLWDQHKDWPGVVGWCFVEAADDVYAKENPDVVSCGGFSTDGTTEFLRGLQAKSPIVRHVPYGFTSHPTDPSQGKSAARNAYLDHADDVEPDWIIVVDADEFYPTDVQEKIVDRLEGISRDRLGVRVKQRHVWRPPGADPTVGMFAREVVGGYWDVPHCRIWRWVPRMRHVSSHNWPDDRGGRMDRAIVRLDATEGDKYQLVHTGYAAGGPGRVAKHRYYVARGEGSETGRIGKRRRMYLRCRDAWENWEEGMPLPDGARVVEYRGPIPEVFR